jgi:histidine ammonia-lyase
VAAAHTRLRSVVAHLTVDREPGPDIAAAAALVRSGELAALAST